MAKMPTMDEWVERLGNKVINEYVYEGRTLKEWIDLMASGKLIILPNNATNGDVIKAICSMWIEYHDTDIEVTVDKKVWNTPYKEVENE